MSRQPVADSATDQFEQILGAMGDGVYVVDEEGAIAHVNDALLELTGYRAADLLGESPDLLIPPEEVGEFERAIRRLLTGEESKTETVQATLETAGGDEVPIEVTLTLLRDDDGAFRGTVGVVRDVSERREREREFRRSERRFEAVFEDPQLMVGLLDPDGTLVEVNRTALEYVDGDRAAVVGQPFPETPWWTEEYREAVAEWVERAASGEYVEYQADLEQPNGDPYWVEGTIRPVTDDEGEVVSLIVSAQDVTERKERQGELERYETLVEVMPDAVIVTDLEGNIIEVHGGTDWSGYEEQNILEQNFGETVTEETAETARRIVRELLGDDGREMATYEHTVISSEGREIPFENHITLLPPDDDGEIPGTMSVLRDISDRKERERALERQNERLEEFASIVSHDLRNPLNVARGTLELLQEDYDDERIDQVVRAQRRMQDIIEDVLTLAQEGEAVESTETVSLAGVADDAWSNVDAGDADLDIEGDRTVLADRGRLQRLLENLFRNAVDYGGAAPTVRVGWVDADGQPAGFYVADDGPGIEPGERENVLESGYSLSEDGTGLGLAIVRRIAEAHGWAVAVTESETGGARIECRGVESA